MYLTYTASSLRATCDVPTNTSFTTGADVSITLTADEGCYWSDVYTTNKPRLEVSPNTFYFDIIDDQTAVLNMTAQGATATIKGRSTAYTAAVLTLDHATTNLSSEPTYKAGETVDVWIRADDGYWFEVEPQLSGCEVLSFDGNETEYTATIKISDNGNSPYLTAGANIKPVVDKYGICRIYTPTADDMAALSEMRTYDLTMSGSTTQIDLGAYVASLRKLFIHLPADKTDNIILGNIETNIECPVVLQDVVTTDCGYVTIEPRFNDTTDYTNTEIEMYLPFVGCVKLDCANVMNQRLHLEYKTNIINGDTLITIKSDSILLYTYNCNVGYDIPYRMNDAIDKFNGKLDIDNGFLHGFKPFIVIRRYTPITRHTFNDNRRAKIEDLTGYIKCEHVFDTLPIPEIERNLIDQLLIDGIII